GQRRISPDTVFIVEQGGPARDTPLPALHVPPSPGAAAVLPQLFLRVERAGKGRNRLADHLVVRRPARRFHLKALVPDLADPGVVVADQVVARLRGADGERRDRDAGGGTEGGHATHGTLLSEMLNQPPVNRGVACIFRYGAATERVR